MELVIDIRETKLIKEVTKLSEKYTKTKISTASLEVGDILIKNQGETLLIIERKAVPDLISSIKDGRYAEQSFRLSGEEQPNHNILYIIEGSPFKPDGSPLYNVLFSLNYYKGFSVYTTASVLQTAILLHEICVKLGRDKDKKPYYTNVINNTEVTANTVESYSKFIKKRKQDNITEENIDEIILSQIPGISSTTACEIMKHYGSIYDLQTAIRENPSCLESIKSSVNNRKLSKTVISNIQKYLGPKTRT